MIESERIELRKLATDASPGPWIYSTDTSEYRNNPQMIWTSSGPGFGTIAQTCSTGLMANHQQACDAAYIAAANPKAVLGLLDDLRAAVAMLWELEWSASPTDEDEEFMVCAYCGGSAGVGHTDHCRLAAVLKSLEGT